MRLIDADTLSVEVDKSKHDNPHSQGLVSVNHRNEHEHFLKMIYDAPAVDAVEVVRCKDCVHWCANYCARDIKGRTNMFYMNADDFCSYGERRKDNG